MLKDLPPFVSGEFKYQIINDRTVRVSCGDNFDICIPMDDLDRGVASYQRAKAEFFAKRAEVIPLKAGR
jgi:hypothetical protein